MEIFVPAFIMLGGAGAAIYLPPVILTALGFTSAGIAAGSVAAKLMSYFAIANGGGVSAGGLIAILQSWAMGGLSGAATIILAAVGGAVGWMVSAIWI